MSSRRDFIKQSGLLTGGLLLSPQILIKKKADVIILGAGFAGLSAAAKLRANGHTVTVLEARNRLGGRVFSHQPDTNENLVIELGAEWVGNSHTRIQELCGQYGLSLDNNQLDTRLIYQGKFYDTDQWKYTDGWEAKFTQLKENYFLLTEKEKLELDKMDWWRYLVNNGISDFDLAIRELADSTDFGESIRHVSAFAALAEYAESSPKNEMDLKIRGGNGKLAEALANEVGSQHILLNQKVTRVMQQGKSVTAVTETGQQYTAARLICTLPTLAIQKIQWEPAFSGERVEALNALQYARICKNAWVSNTKFWKDPAFDMLTDSTSHYYYHATKNQVDQSSKGVFISYSIGDKADVMSRMTEEIRRTEIVETLQPAFGDVSAYLEKQVLYHWGNDEFSKGAYAMYGVGQWFGLMPVLRAPWKNILFAGEHLADWQGFMEGAINTGEAAAEELM